MLPVDIVMIQFCHVSSFSNTPFQFQGKQKMELRDWQQSLELKESSKAALNHPSNTARPLIVKSKIMALLLAIWNDMCKILVSVIFYVFILPLLLMILPNFSNIW